MLADKQRMAFYKAAIERHIQPGDRVVDLGTGTGIFAALAARRGAAHVYAVDHSEILTQARQLAQANQVSNVEFISMHSSKFKVDEPLDVILHEQMGDCLFDEGMVANVADLRDRLLRPGGLILPSLFELYCEPIKVRDDRVVPFIWELKVHGYDYACLSGSRPQEPRYYNLASSDLNLVEHFLGEPEPVLRVDLLTINEDAMPRKVSFTRRVINPGRLDGYAVFFRAMAGEGISLSSSPLDSQRAPHWGFRILRTERDELKEGDEIDVTLKVGRWSDPDSWHWSHQKRSLVEPGLAGRHP
jgi:protein arginine N-methyltransferase 1